MNIIKLFERYSDFDQNILKILVKENLCSLMHKLEKLLHLIIYKQRKEKLAYEFEYLLAKNTTDHNNQSFHSSKIGAIFKKYCCKMKNRYENKNMSIQDNISRFIKINNYNQIRNLNNRKIRRKKV